jgi:hypothetical protein
LAEPWQLLALSRTRVFAALDARGCRHLARAGVFVWQFLALARQGRPQLQASCAGARSRARVARSCRHLVRARARAPGSSAAAGILCGRALARPGRPQLQASRTGGSICLGALGARTPGSPAAAGILYGRALARPGRPQLSASRTGGYPCLAAFGARAAPQSLPALSRTHMAWMQMVWKGAQKTSKASPAPGMR